MLFASRSRRRNFMAYNEAILEELAVELADKEFERHNGFGLHHTGIATQRKAKADAKKKIIEWADLVSPLFNDSEKN
jgi:hypothetical protein